MDNMEALTSLLEKIPNLEDVEEEVNVIKSAFENQESDAENFKDKYLALKEKYIARFRGGDIPETVKKEETETETNPETSKMEDLVE